LNISVRKIAVEMKVFGKDRNKLMTGKAVVPHNSCDIG
jgi:hypothetical protein